MILDNIDLSKEYDFTLVLTKKNKTPITILKEATDRNLERNLETFDKLSFSIPYYIEDQFTHEQKINPNYNKVMEENMILLKCGEITNPIFQSYFIIKNISESSDKMSKQVECSSREVSLNKNIITLNGVERQLAKDEVNAADGIFDILEQETSWKLGYISPNAKVEHINGGTNNKYRFFDALSKPWYDFLNTDVSTAFNVILMYDTVNKLINVYDKDDYGTHTGIILSEENYIKNLNKKTSSESVVTKLEVTGRNDLTFEDVNPLGTTYILNYDFFRQNGQMSQELMDALDKYDVLLNIKNTEFQGLRTQLDTLNDTLVTKQGEMTTLTEELVALRHIQSGYMSSNDNTNLPTATTNVNNKVIEIANKKAEIDSINIQIGTINIQIGVIADSINKVNAKDTQNNLIFNADLLEELEDFSFCEYWNSSYYNTSISLMNGAKDVLKDWSVPSTDFDIDVEDFFASAETQRYWDKINLGDFCRTYSTKINTNVDVRIVGYTYNIDSNDLKISFSNKNKKRDDARSISGTVKRSNEASKIVNVKKLEWNDIKNTKNAVETFLNNALDLGRQSVVSQMGKNKIDITENGIFCINADNEDQQIAILSSIIAFSSDGWQSCNTCLDNTGLYAKYLVGQVILGEQLFIANEDGTVEITGLGMTIKDEDGHLKVKIGKLDNGNYGISIYNSSGQVVLDERGMLSEYSFSIADNVDSAHPLKVNFFINDNLLSVKQVKIAFNCENFRSYEKSASAGGNSSITSASGGGQTYTNAIQSPYWNVSPIVTEDANPNTPHYHIIDTHVLDHGHQIILPNHQHGVTLPSHTHGLDYGIYESTIAQGVTVSIDGTLRDNNGGSGYNSNQVLDITQYIQTSGLHEIDLSSSLLGRISCTVYVKSFVST